MMGFGIAVLVLVVVLICFMTFDKVEQTTQFGGGSDGRDLELNYVGGKGGANNPGFLIHTDIKWKGKTNSTGCKFENFSTMAYGIRAWYVNLFGKYKNGQITNPNQMIDVLTPAGSDNPENARNNYKAKVNQATSWLELGVAVFDFEANPDWRNMGNTEKMTNLEQAFRSAVMYSFNGQTPQYWK